MAEPASNGAGRDLAERILLAVAGAVAATGERAQDLAEILASGGYREQPRGDADTGRRWRTDAVRLTDRATATLAGAFRELGLVTREELDELELRVAQLEHRLRLLEQPPSPPPARGVQL